MFQPDIGVVAVAVRHSLRTRCRFSAHFMSLLASAWVPPQPLSDSSPPIVPFNSRSQIRISYRYHLHLLFSPFSSEILSFNVLDDVLGNYVMLQQ